MIPLPRKGNRPSIVSHLQVNRLHEELANARKKIDEYEDLIASLYDRLETAQSLACEKCRVNFEQFTSADFTPLGAHHDPPSTSALYQPHSDNLSESAKSHTSLILRAHAYPHSRNPSASSMVDNRSHRSASLSSNISSISYQPNPTSLASNPNGKGPIYLQAPSISSRASSNDDGQYLHAPPNTSSRPSSSASNNERHQASHLAKPVLSTTHDSNLPDGWSISFDKKVKPSIEVKLVDMLVFQEMISCLKFSPDGNYLAVGLDGGRAYIHDMILGKKSRMLTECSSTNLPPERDRIWVMNFSPDGRYLATGNQSFIVRIWDIAKNHVRNIFKHKAGVSAVDFSRNGRFVVSAAHDGTVRAWSMKDGSCRIYRSQTDFSFYSLRITPDGRHIANVDYDGKLRIVDFRTGQEVEWKAHDGPATISIMPNGKGVVTGGWDKTLKYWNLDFLRETQTGSLELNESLKFTGHTNVVRGVTILADGKWVISVSEDLTTRVWDSQTASRQCTMTGHETDIWWVDASPVGNYFASGGNDGRVAIWRCDPISSAL